MPHPEYKDKIPSSLATYTIPLAIFLYTKLFFCMANLVLINSKG